TISHTRWCRPALSTPPMYIDGRLRTGSSFSRTSMFAAVYVFIALTAALIFVLFPRQFRDSMPLSLGRFCEASLIEQRRLGLAVGLGLVGLLWLLALDLVPVHQLDRRRHHPLEARSFDGLKTLAAAGDRLVPAGELHLRAARRLDHQLVGAVADEGPADAHVVAFELDADDALAHAREDVDLLDREVQHVPVPRRQKDARLVPEHP